MIVTKPLIDETLIDAEAVVKSRFPPVACDILRKEMRNPLRRICNEVGDIAYNDGKPVCFQAFIARQMFFKDEKVFANVGGMTVLAPEAPVEALIDVKAAAVKNRIGNKIGFGNTLCKATEKMSRRHKDLFGPEACCYWRFRVIRPLDFLWYCFSRKILKRPIPKWKLLDAKNDEPFSRSGDFWEIRKMRQIAPDEFDGFWRRYVEKNEGLVCSRTAEELDWMFGEEIKDGRCVMLVDYVDGLLDGYIILKDGSRAGRRWQIIDWVALENSKSILDRLLKVACCFLRQRTPAMLLESIGFPTFIQPVLKRYLSYRRFAGNNFFSYGYRNRKTTGKEFAEACEMVIDTEKSWFFGPYDGDMCM